MRRGEEEWIRLLYLMQHPSAFAAQGAASGHGAHFRIRANGMLRRCIPPDDAVYVPVQKNRPDSERARAAIEEILVTELVLRWGCIKEVSGGVAPTAWATIPSTINSPRAGVEHPLHRIVRQVLPSVPEVGLRAAGVKSRSLSPDLFQLEGEYAPNTLRHVLLIDDTWTTGGNVQSAAVALKRAGAQRVTVFCVARVVNYAFCASIGEGVANGFRSLPFRGGNWCPWHCVRES